MIRLFYSRVFTLIFWQPIIWNQIKPANGVIDNKAHWFHRHAVKQLNNCRGVNDGWCLFKLWFVIIKDPHAHIQKKYYRWSESHLFAVKR